MDKSLDSELSTYINMRAKKLTIGNWSKTGHYGLHVTLVL
jgi:hypothetical protein